VGLDRLCRLNSNYRERFGFHFIYAVNGRSKYDVLAALECRLAGEPRGARQSACADLPDRAFSAGGDSACANS